MPKYKPPKEHQFKKGQSGNPLGGKLMNPAMRALKRLTNDELIDLGNLVLKGNMKALREVSKDPKVSVLKTMVASVAVKIITKGDMNALDVLLNRLIGKVKDQVAVNVTNAEPVKVVITLPDNGFSAKPEKDGNEQA